MDTNEKCPYNRLHRILIFILMGIPLLMAVASMSVALANAPAMAWNDMRVAPAIYLANGIQIYGQNGMPGLTTNYGPISAIAYLPAAIGQTPEAAIRIGVICAWIYGILAILVPSWLIIKFSKTKLPNQIRWCLVLFPLMAVLAMDATKIGLFSIHADAPAICALSLAACAISCRGKYNIPIAALLCVAAIGCKVTYATGAIASVSVIWWLDSIKRAAYFSVWFAFILFITSAIFGAWFGCSQLWDAMVTVPASHPWVLLERGDPAYSWQKFTTIKWKMVCAAQSATLMSLVLLPSCVLIGLLWSKTHKNETINKHSFTYRWRICAMIFSIYMAVFAVIGISKYGGDINVLAPLHMFMLLLGISVIPSLLLNRFRNIRLIASLIIILTLLSARFISYTLFPKPIKTADIYPTLRMALKKNQGQLWLPSRPLAHWYYDRSITHSGDVLFCYKLGNRDIPINWMQTFLPPVTNKIAGFCCDPASNNGFMLAQDLQKTKVPGLDDRFSSYLWTPPMTKGVPHGNP